MEELENITGIARRRILHKKLSSQKYLMGASARGKNGEHQDTM